MTPIRYSLIAALLFSHTTMAQNPLSYELPVVLSAGDLLPASALVGSSHRVRDQVVTDGYMAQFVIDTDFGTFEVQGLPQVARSINEADAIRKLVETSKGDLFAEGLKRSITQPIDAVTNIVAHPVTSIKQAPKTVGHFFSKIGASVERGVDKLKAGQEAGKNPSAGDIGEAAKRVAGFDKAKLDTARQLGVDPYSDNVRLQEEMDKVTWAFFAGGLPLRIGAAVASAGVAVAATNMVGVPEETYALTQSELALRDRQSLMQTGLAEADITPFQIQPHLSTTRRHRIVKALEAMPDTAGRERVIQLANLCVTPSQADFLVAALEMLAARQKSGAANYKELHLYGRLPGASTADGVVEIPAPVDYVTWTEQVAGFANREDLGSATKRLIHTGRLSEAASKGFSAAAWQTLPVAYP